MGTLTKWEDDPGTLFPDRLTYLLSTVVCVSDRKTYGPHMLVNRSGLNTRSAPLTRSKLKSAAQQSGNRRGQTQTHPARLEIIHLRAEPATKSVKPLTHGNSSEAVTARSGAEVRGHADIVNLKFTGRTNCDCREVRSPGTAVVLTMSSNDIEALLRANLSHADVVFLLQVQRRDLPMDRRPSSSAYVYLAKVVLEQREKTKLFLWQSRSFSLLL